SKSGGSIIEENISTDDVEAQLSGFSLGVRVSPRYYLDFEALDATWGLMLGLDLGYATSFFDHETNLIERLEDETLIFRDTYMNNLIENYTTDFTSINVSFHIGIYRKLVTSL
ncbi:MAG: hypothetical protein AAFO07_01495, partial [Bacteroidota bacterium]